MKLTDLSSKHEWRAAADRIGAAMVKAAERHGHTGSYASFDMGRQLGVTIEAMGARIAFRVAVADIYGPDDDIRIEP